jgi:uncharacterized protein (TIGR02266 family)
MGRKKIVLVDDVELFLMLEKTFFSREDFELITARNGREAFKAIRETNPDMVFMDLYMPEMNGDECCHMVKMDPKYRDIPIIIVTHGGREDDLVRCRRAGCDDIVLKPINRHDFMATAQKFLQVRERAVRRFRARLRVRYCARSRELADYSIDLSTGGLFLETAHPLPVETPLDLEFILPETGTIIQCKARVAWVNYSKLPSKSHLPAGMGVQFLDLTLNDMNAIRNYIEIDGLEPSW